MPKSGKGYVRSDVFNQGSVHGSRTDHAMMMRSLFLNTILLLLGQNVNLIFQGDSGGDDVKDGVPGIV